MKPLRILSLGAGVQSTTVLLMACVGEIEPIDHALFADTMAEPQAVYRHLIWLERFAREHGVLVERVMCREKGLSGNLREDILHCQKAGKKRFHALPYHVLNPDGTTGITRRQCTTNYKVQPQYRKIKELLGLKPRGHWPKTPTAQHLYGISWDEVHRMRQPVGPWELVEHPLVDKRMTRLDCLQWIEAHGFPRPPRSACIFCPFRSDMEWSRLQNEEPESFTDACFVDREVRDGGGGMRGQFFLHRSCKPLDQVRWNIDPTPDMFGNECMGLCGV